MGCMEHHCSGCGTVTVNNSTNKNNKMVCGECGGVEFLSVFDEADDHD